MDDFRPCQTNTDFRWQETELNTHIFPATEINEQLVDYDRNELIGNTIAEKYIIERRINVAAGEADIYLCNYEGKKYVAKVYRRQRDVRTEVIKELQSIDSPLIARIQEYGSTIIGNSEVQYEILPYYQRGSIQGKIYSFEVLKEHIIPEINQALKLIHDKNILHKDIKPSNIMLRDDEEYGIALIDFGISSALEPERTMVVTSFAGTTHYSAPEANMGQYRIESDYYSFGMTIYELFCGYTVYNMNLKRAEVEMERMVNPIYYPDNMPESLQSLIQGLTYYLFVDRYDENNPHSRWTYDEVQNWCEGKEQTIPGQVGRGERYHTYANGNIPTYTFEGKEYRDAASLVKAFALNWGQGKERIRLGGLKEAYKTVHTDISAYCAIAEEKMRNSTSDTDMIFWELLYQILLYNNERAEKIFLWKNKVYKSLVEFGKDMLGCLRKEDGDSHVLDELLKKNVLSKFVKDVCRGEAKHYNVLKEFEDKHNQLLRYSASNKDRQLNYYKLAYMLAGVKDRSFCISKQEFKTVEEMASYMKELLTNAYDDLDIVEFCNQIISADSSLDPQFEAWLWILGKEDIVQEWRKNRLK